MKIERTAEKITLSEIESNDQVKEAAIGFCVAGVCNALNQINPAVRIVAAKLTTENAILAWRYPAESTSQSVKYWRIAGISGPLAKEDFDNA